MKWNGEQQAVFVRNRWGDGWSREEDVDRGLIIKGSFLCPSPGSERGKSRIRGSTIGKGSI